MKTKSKIIGLIILTLLLSLSRNVFSQDKPDTTFTKTQLIKKYEQQIENCKKMLIDRQKEFTNADPKCIWNSAQINQMQQLINELKEEGKDKGKNK